MIQFPCTFEPATLAQHQLPSSCRNAVSYVLTRSTATWIAIYVVTSACIVIYFQKCTPPPPLILMESPLWHEEFILKCTNWQFLFFLFLYRNLFLWSVTNYILMEELQVDSDWNVCFHSHSVGHWKPANGHKQDYGYLLEIRVSVR